MRYVDVESFVCVISFLARDKSWCRFYFLVKGIRFIEVIEFGSDGVGIEIIFGGVLFWSLCF